LLFYIEDIGGKFLRNVTYLPKCGAINPKDSNLHIHRRPNLKFFNVQTPKIRAAAMLVLEVEV
jgi:hypothetical protein